MKTAPSWFIQHRCRSSIGVSKGRVFTGEAIRMTLRALLTIVAMALAGCVSHTGRPEPMKITKVAESSFSVQPDIVYTPAQWPAALSADIYEPAAAGPFPAVLMIHGGSWRSRTRADMNSIAAKVARRGYVVMNLDYRLAPEWTFPSQLQDLQQAVLFLRANAGKYRVQPDRIAAWGYSAGAHLAALLGVTGPGDRQFLTGTRIQAVVAGSAPVDLSYYPSVGLTTDFMGVPYRGNEARWAEASPLRLVSSDDPPTFLYHGAVDILVLSKNSYRMYDSLSRAGVPAELYIMRGAEHALMFRLSPVHQSVEFLNRNLRATPSRQGRIRGVDQDELRLREPVTEDTALRVHHAYLR
jgi:acetyl esterase/lipase